MPAHNNRDLGVQFIYKMACPSGLATTQDAKSNYHSGPVKAIPRSSIDLPFKLVRSPLSCYQRCWEISLLMVVGGHLQLPSRFRS